MKYKAIAFDWDGTLANSMGNIIRCVQNACRDLELECPKQDVLQWCIGLSLESIWGRFFSQYSDQVYMDFRKSYLKYNLASQQEIVLFDGIKDMLQTLKAQGVLLAVATGKGYLSLGKALEAVGLIDFFDALKTADKTAGKPDPLMLEEILWELDLQPYELLVVGDTTHDLKMALNAGVDAVGVNYGGAHDEKELQKVPSKYIAHTVTQLQSWLLQQIK